MLLPLQSSFLVVAEYGIYSPILHRFLSVETVASSIMIVKVKSTETCLAPDSDWHHATSAACFTALAGTSLMDSFNSRASQRGLNRIYRRSAIRLGWARRSYPGNNANQSRSRLKIRRRKGHSWLGFVDPASCHHHRDLIIDVFRSAHGEGGEEEKKGTVTYCWFQGSAPIRTVTTT